MEELTKEELIQTPKKKHRWIFMVYSVLCILFTVNCFLFITPPTSILMVNANYLLDYLDCI